MNKKFQLTNTQAKLLVVAGIAFMIWFAFIADFKVLIKF